MPVTRAGRPVSNPGWSRDRLVDAMVRELRGEENPAPRPSIFEVAINRGKSFHIIVVWDRWATVPPEERSDVILKAYDQYEAADNASAPIVGKTTVALGATPDEVIRRGLLPYEVRPTFTNLDPADLVSKGPQDDAYRAMSEEGGFAWGEGGHVALCLPTLSMAKEAKERLEKRRIAKVEWAVFESD